MHQEFSDCTSAFTASAHQSALAMPAPTLHLAILAVGVQCAPRTRFKRTTRIRPVFGPDLYSYRANIHPAASEPGVLRPGPRPADQCHGQGVLHGQDEYGAGEARSAVESTHGAYQRDGGAGAYIEAGKVIMATKGIVDMSVKYKETARGGLAVNIIEC